MKTTGTWIAVLFVGVVGAGCKKVGESAAAAEKTAEGEAAANPDDALGLYVHCFNEVGSRVKASYDSYAEWVDLKKGPTGKEARVEGISWIDDYHTKKCLENLATAPATGPLAVVTKGYVDTLKALLPLVTETKTYYEQKNYKDDAFAKGKELHPKVVGAFDAWNAANQSLRNLWEEQHKAARDRSLAKLEKSVGRKSEQFVASQVMNVSEIVLEVALEEGAKPDQVIAALKQYQTAHEEMAAFYGPGLTASTDTSRYMFKQEADALQIQIKEAGRTLAASKPLPDEGDGSTESILKAYNRLVERSNSITWD